MDAQKSQFGLSLAAVPRVPDNLYSSTVGKNYIRKTFNRFFLVNHDELYLARVI